MKTKLSTNGGSLHQRRAINTYKEMNEELAKLKQDVSFILKRFFGGSNPALNKGAFISSCGLSAETSSEADKEILFIKNSEGKREKCLEYIKCLYKGFRDCEYEMALQIGDVEMFENFDDYYSELQKQTCRKMATIYPIVHIQRLPFLGIIEIPTGKFTVPFYKNYNIKNHDIFNERINRFFERKTKERRIFNKQI